MSIGYEAHGDGIYVVTLNRPERLNALDTRSKEELGRIWQEAAKGPEVRVLVLRGAGEKAFCAGSDVKEIRDTGRMVDTDLLLRAIPGGATELDKPVVAALHGFSIGMGLTLAIHCDFRIAAPTTRLGFPEVQHGMISGVSAVTLPGLIGEAAALDLMLSGRIIGADEAKAIGLVHEIAASPFDAALALARRLAANSPRAVALTKRLVLAERTRRLQAHRNTIDAARIGVTDSAEYGDVVAGKEGAGRARV